MLQYILRISQKSPCSFAPVRWLSKPPRKMKQQWRKDHNKEYRQDPGLKRRLDALKLDYDKELDIEDTDVEPFEPDIMAADEQYDDLERYRDKVNRQDIYKMIERKHFQPPKEPNLLTWAEKDQIRYLHEQDPKEWSIERLSESFPATPVVIRKILKSHWLPFNEKRVRKHDAAVEQNWKLLAAGKIPKTQIQQLILKGFKNRKPLPALTRPRAQSSEVVALATHTKTPERRETSLLDTGKPSEFGGILQSYYNRLEKRDDDNSETLSIPSLPKKYKLNHDWSGSVFHTSDPQGESYLIEEDNDKNNHNITLEKYREKVLKQYSTKKTNSPEENETNFKYQSWLEKQQEKYKREEKEERLVQGEMIKDIMQDITRQTKIGKTGYEITPKYKESEMLEVKMDRRSGLKNPSAREPYIYATTVGYQRPLGAAEEYPDHIQIPESQKKEGRLYKVGDRYYDEDGELLYRVPGMES